MITTFVTLPQKESELQAVRDRLSSLEDPGGQVKNLDSLLDDIHSGKLVCLPEDSEVVVKYDTLDAGAGWYVWEKATDDEGYVGFFETRPTLEDLKNLHPSYFEVSL